MKQTLVGKKTEDVNALIDEHLEDDERIDLEFSQIRIEEKSTGIDQTIVSYIVKLNGFESEFTNKMGAGVVDALMSSFIEKFGNDYLSLKNFNLSNFKCQADIKHPEKVKGNQSDAVVSVSLEVFNSLGGNASFACEDRSMIRASVGVVEKMFKFLMEAEVLFKKCKRILAIAPSPSIRQKYVNIMSDVVKVGNYKGVSIEEN